jgi:PilZ domain-containing protein
VGSITTTGVPLDESCARSPRADGICSQRGPYPRFHTHLKATVREQGGQKSDGHVSNISRSGAFVRLESLPAQGSVVELEITFPGFLGHHTVHAYVVHIAPRRGVGVQFVGASDSFCADLEQYLAEISR